MKLRDLFTSPVVEAPPVVPEPPHVRLHVTHEGMQSGDMTIDGWWVGSDSDFAFLIRASILGDDGRVTQIEGRADVPLSRIFLREHVVAVSTPIALAAASGQAASG